MSRKILVLAVLAVLAVLFPTASFAATARGNATANVTRSYAFTMPFTGAVELTLTWNQPHDDLFLIMACGDGSSTLEYSSVATQERVARLDAGVLGGLTCVFGVASFQRAGTFTVALSTSGAGPGLSPRRRGASSSLELVELDEREAAALGVHDLADKVRALRR